MPPVGLLTPIRSIRREHLRFEVYRQRSPITGNHDWRWRLIAGNNKRIANSGEGYRNHADCIHAINLVASTDGVPITYARGVMPPR